MKNQNEKDKKQTDGVKRKRILDIKENSVVEMRKNLKKKKSVEVKTPAKEDMKGEMEVEGTQEEGGRNKETRHNAIESPEQVTAGSATV